MKYNCNTNPTYNEILDFLARDQTDLLRYLPGEFLCNDFNTLVHNHAQFEGFNCRLCFLYDLDNITGHTCLAWDSNDYGRIYTDSTGVPWPNYNYNSYDKIIYNVKIGEQANYMDIESGYGGKFNFILGGVELF